MTPRKSNGPTTGAVANRSMRSDPVRRVIACVLTDAVTAASIHPNRSSAAASSSADDAAWQFRGWATTAPSAVPTAETSASTP